MAMNAAQVINTTPSAGAPEAKVSAYWVAGWMAVGVAGLVAIYVIFRRHVEL